MEAQGEKGPGPLFSVIVPIYNTEPYLRKCVDSILGQTYRDFELILVDNGSTDGCPMVCDGYARQDGRVRVVHKAHGALTSSRNAGLAVARGAYASYVDSDDWVESTYMETMARCAEEFSQPDVILFGAIAEFKTWSKRMDMFRANGYYGRGRLEREVIPCMMMDRWRSHFSHLRGRVLQAPWNKVFKRELLKEHRCRDERITQAEDISFVYECLYFADCVYFCPEVLYHYNCANQSALTRIYCEDLFEQYQWVHSYVEERLGGRDPKLDVQIRMLRGYFLLLALENEVKHSAGLWEGARQIREKIGGSRMLRECPLRAIPFRSLFYLLPLKLRWYHLAWLEAKLFMLRGDD